MSVDDSGRITWTTGIPDIGPHGVEVEAVNADGLTSRRSIIRSRSG